MSKFRIDVKLGVIATNQFDDKIPMSMVQYENVEASSKDEALEITKEKYKDSDVQLITVY